MCQLICSFSCSVVQVTQSTVFTKKKWWTGDRPRCVSDYSPFRGEVMMNRGLTQVCQWLLTFQGWSHDEQGIDPDVSAITRLSGMKWCWTGDRRRCVSDYSPFICDLVMNRGQTQACQWLLTFQGWSHDEQGIDPGVSVTTHLSGVKSWWTGDRPRCVSDYLPFSDEMVMNRG